MAIFTIQEPEVVTISLDTIKRYARINGPEDDAILSTMVSLAEKLIVDRTGVVASGRDVIIKMVHDDGCELRIPFIPVQMIKSAVLDNGRSIISQCVIQDGILKVIEIPSDDHLTITIRCGYEDENLVPADIKLAILMQVVHLYDNRNGDGGNIASGAESLLIRFKKFRL